MERYTPDTAPIPSEWLDLDEGERIELVADYHRREKIVVANRRLHAAIHTVVETQLAMPVPEVVQTFARLQREGLTRHDAIHAVGSVLAEQLLAVMRDPPASNNLAGDYLASLESLTAERWRSLG